MQEKRQFDRFADKSRQSKENHFVKVNSKSIRFIGTLVPLVLEVAGTPWPDLRWAHQVCNKLKGKP